MKYCKQRIELPFEVTIEEIDLGCGQTKDHGVGIDMVDFGQAVLWDLRQGIPLPDNSVKKISSSHFFEHVEPKDLHLLFNEMYRIGKDGCMIYIAVPHADCTRAKILTHLTEWDEDRVIAIVGGLADCGENWFELTDMHREGIELRFALKVTK